MGSSSRPIWLAVTALTLLLGAAPQTKDTSAYEAAYRFAYGNDGLNLSRSDAMAFADKATARSNPQSYLEVYKKAYSFAYTPGGMNLGTTDARQFADRIAARGDALRVLTAFEEAFKFAYSSAGLNQSVSEARKFAEQRSGLNEPEKPSAVATTKPASRKVLSRVETLKLLADLSQSLATQQKEADALIEGITASPPVSRADADQRLTALATKLRAKLAEIEAVALAEPPGAPKGP